MPPLSEWSLSRAGSLPGAKLNTHFLKQESSLGFFTNYRTARPSISLFVHAVCMYVTFALVLGSRNIFSSFVCVLYTTETIPIQSPSVVGHFTAQLSACPHMIHGSSVTV